MNHAVGLRCALDVISQMIPCVYTVQAINEMRLGRIAAGAGKLERATDHFRAIRYIGKASAEVFVVRSPKVEAAIENVSGGARSRNAGAG